ncbi:hypothetical protein RCH12_002785 [Cryobacterium sp. MP_3.1]|uniref:terminase small subunit n=1 Tax=Cryobacterium sp. MP_3.1 TaxID=3071711 RepID=UPI002DFAB140|nr:hypothetical protein [Cryobacterium sp. MP_3.1]
MAAPRKIRTAVLASFEASAAITAADAGAQLLALTYADAIDMAKAAGDAGTLTKALYLGPHLLNVLRALGCTPDGREAAAPDTETDSAAAALANLQAEANA